MTQRTTTQTLNDELTEFFGTRPARLEVLVYRSEDQARSPYAGNLRGFNAAGDELAPDWEAHSSKLLDITFDLEAGGVTVGSLSDYQTLIASEEGRLEVGHYLINDCETDPYSTLNDYLMQSGQGYVTDGSWVSLTLPESDPLQEAWSGVQRRLTQLSPEARFLDVRVSRSEDATRLPQPDELRLRAADGHLIRGTEQLLDHVRFYNELTTVLCSGPGLIASGQRVRLDLQAPLGTQGSLIPQ